MFKKVALLLLIIFITCGCSCTKPPVEDNKLYLTDSYYNEGNYVDVTSNEINTISTANVL